MDNNEQIKFDKMEDLIGQNAKEVINYLRKKNIKTRIVQEDGQNYILTRDYQPARYNFYVKHGLITSVKMG